MNPTKTFIPCDGKECGHRSYVFFTVSGRPLSFCGHHARKYWDGIQAAADEGSIVDNRYLILV